MEDGKLVVPNGLIGPALGLGHLGHGLRPPSIGVARFFFFFLVNKEKIKNVSYVYFFFSTLKKPKNIRVMLIYY